MIRISNLLLLLTSITQFSAFTPPLQQKQVQPQQQKSFFTTTHVVSAVSRKSFDSSFSSSSFRSKRQERIGQVLQTELSSIFHSYPHEIKLLSTETTRDDDLLKRISFVRVDMSPDLRQAKIIISVYKKSNNASSSSSSSSSSNNTLDRRRAYSFLVQNNKQIRHALSQRLRHWKILPELSFEQADVGAAVDVMMLLDNLAKDKEFKRATVGKFGGDDDSVPLYMEDDGDEDNDDLEWLEEEEQGEDLNMELKEVEEDEVEEEEEEEEERKGKSKHKGKRKSARRQYRIEDL